MTRSLTFRTWGDGGNRTAEHYIVDISYANEAVVCSCGATVERGGFLSLERAWDHHRDVDYKAPPLGDLATDEEVAEFLRKVEDPTYESNMAGSHYVSAPGADLSNAFALLERLYNEYEEQEHAKQ